MIQFKTILCPTDFSATAAAALPYARALAKLGGGAIHLATVIDPNERAEAAGLGGLSRAESEQLAESTAEHAGARLEGLARTTDWRGVTVQVHTRRGRPAQELVALAAELKADLIVMASHGRLGFQRFMLGSTCEEVIRHSLVPVLTVKHPEREFVERDGEEIHLRRVLCPVDLSDISYYAAGYAAELCGLFDATLVLQHTTHPVESYVASYRGAGEPAGASAVEESLRRFVARYPKVRVETRVVSGPPAQLIFETASREQVNLIVMTTHGRGGLGRAILGSVAEKTVRWAPCPVLTIRPAAAEMTPQEAATPWPATEPSASG